MVVDRQSRPSESIRSGSRSRSGRTSTEHRRRPTLAAFSQGITPVPAPIPADQLADALKPFGQSTMLPPAAYTSAEVFAWEQRHFFLGWQCVGRGADLPEPGSQRAERIGATTVLLVRADDGAVHAYAYAYAYAYANANACRHRGHELLPCGGSTRRKSVRCPYHAWSYRLDGSLIAAPGYRQVAGFDASQYGLVPLRVQANRVDYLGVVPNLLISLHPDYVMTHRMVPLAPSSTWVECAWAFPPEAVERDGFDPGYAVDFWDITNRQDWAACESVQRGLESGMARPGPLSPQEDGVYQFVTMVARGYSGGAAHLKPQFADRSAS
jgi:phenylpropionate dioxygenase-like ring-hydroxylating dioxygenase large terminal subunit